MRKILLTFLLAPAALAQEVWLEVPALRLPPNQPTPLRVLVGDNFAGRPWPGRAAKIVRLVRYGPTPADSATLAPTDSILTLPTPGLHTVLLQSAESFAELPAADFNRYLQAQGLDFILDKRREAGSAARPGREAYRRCAKTLLQVAAPAALPPPATDSAALRPRGLPLELVPEQNPYRLVAGRSLTVRLLRAGLPVRGGLVQVWQRQPGGLPTTHFTTRTNGAGRLIVRLMGPGPYLLAAVGMVPAPPALRPRADWHSTWASLTFGGPPAAPAR